MTLVLPSVLISAFAYQASEAERRARLEDRRLRLEEKATRLVSELAEHLQRTAHQLREEVEERDADTSLPQLAERVARDATRDPILADVFAYDVQGRRVYPAPRARPRIPGAPPPWLGQLGGASAALWAQRPEEVLRAAQELRSQDFEAAAQLLEGLLDHPLPEVRIAALYDLGRAYQDTATQAGLLNALDVYDRLGRYPLESIDALGRNVVAWSRLHRARVFYALPNPQAYARALREVWDDLQTAARSLPAAVFAELAERTADYLQGDDPTPNDDPLPVLPLIEARQRSEDSARLLDELFAADLHQLTSDPPQATPNTPFLSERDGTRTVILVYAYVWDRTGHPVGLITATLDVDALIQDLRAHARRWLLTRILPDEARPPEVQPSAVVEAPLQFPLQGWSVRVDAPPDAPSLVESALDLPRETVHLWAIGLSIFGILAGVGVSTRTILKESKAAQLKSDFVSNVTHELKTPLTSIRMFLDTLMLGRVTGEDEAQECLQVMARESERLTRLIEQLLVFSRIESRKWRLRLGFERPRQLVVSAISILADQLGQNPEDLGIEVTVVQELPQVAVDKFALVEATLCLLHNAWKYSAGPQRKVRVVLSVRRRYVEIAVEDNGIGVPRRDRRRIFVKFERGSNAELGRIEGSGIGLTLADMIVKAHGGKIKYAPLKPRGSRFALLLPK